MAWIVTGFGTGQGIAAAIFAALKKAGANPATLIWIAAIGGALITIGIVADFYRYRCKWKPPTLAACTAGVVQATVPAFSGSLDVLFPFVATHDRVDVVVRCDFWPLVVTNAAYVWCNDDPDMSPELRCYYKTKEVCRAGLGATIGAVVLGAAGAYWGALVGLATFAAIGCASVVGCFFALLLALVLAVLVAAAFVLLGALVGGNMARQFGSATGPTAAINPKDYITTCGGLFAMGDDMGARVYWFVTATVPHGSSTNSPPFDHTDPDCLFTPKMDACPTCGN